MLDFLYYAPTMIYFGRNAEIDVAKAIQNENVQKVMIVYGGESVIKSGLLERVCATLDAAGIEHVRLAALNLTPVYRKFMRELILQKKKGWNCYLPLAVVALSTLVKPSVLDSIMAAMCGISTPENRYAKAAILWVVF